MTRSSPGFSFPDIIAVKGKIGHADSYLNRLNEFYPGFSFSDNAGTTAGRIGSALRP